MARFELFGLFVVGSRHQVARVICVFSMTFIGFFDVVQLFFWPSCSIWQDLHGI